MNFVQKVISDPIGAVQEVVETAKDAVKNKVAEVLKPSTEPVNDTVKAINDVSKSIVDTVKEGAKKAAEVAVGVAKAVQGEVKGVASKSGKELKLSEEDIVRIMKVASTEVVPSLKGKNFENQAAGVVDTILNRTASGKFGGSVKDVVNQRWAFSDINAPRKGAYGSVDKVPMSRVSKKMENFVRAYLEERANGKVSSVGQDISYANPNFLGEASQSTKKWVREVEAQAKKSGQIYGSGNATHVHGTPSADAWKKPKQYYISTPSTNNSVMSAPNIQNTASLSGNPHKNQINGSSLSASNVTIHQSFKTDMNLNGVSNPMDAANAVKRQQENSMAIMARAAQGVFV